MTSKELPDSNGKSKGYEVEKQKDMSHLFNSNYSQKQIGSNKMIMKQQQIERLNQEKLKRKQQKKLTEQQKQQKQQQQIQKLQQQQLLYLQQQQLKQIQLQQQQYQQQQTLQKQASQLDQQNVDQNDINILFLDHQQQTVKKKHQLNKKMQREKYIIEQEKSKILWVEIELINRKIDPIRVKKILRQLKSFITKEQTKEEILSMVMNEIFLQKNDKTFNITNNESEIEYLQKNLLKYEQDEITELQFQQNILKIIIEQYPKNWIRNFIQFNGDYIKPTSSVLKKRNSILANSNNNNILGSITNVNQPKNKQFNKMKTSQFGSQLKMMVESQTFSHKCLQCGKLEEKEVTSNYLEKSVRCEHFYCKSCLEFYLQEKMKDIHYTKILNIQCPFQGCEQYIEQMDLVNHIHDRDVRMEYFYKRFKYQFIMQYLIIECPICQCLLKNYPERKSSKNTGNGLSDSIQQQINDIGSGSGNPNNNNVQNSFRDIELSLEQMNSQKDNKYLDLSKNIEENNDKSLTPYQNLQQTQQDQKLNTIFGGISEIMSEEKEKPKKNENQLSTSNAMTTIQYKRNRKITEYQSEYEQDNDNEENPQKQPNLVDDQSLHSPGASQLDKEDMQNHLTNSLNGFSDEIDFSSIKQQQQSNEKHKKYIHCINCDHKICGQCFRTEHINSCLSTLEEEYEEKFKRFQFGECPSCETYVSAEYGVKQVKCWSCQTNYCGQHFSFENFKWNEQEHLKCESYYDQIAQQAFNFELKGGKNDNIKVEIKIQDDESKIVYYKNNIFQTIIKNIEIYTDKQQIKFNTNELFDYMEEDYERIVAILRYMARTIKTPFFIDTVSQQKRPKKEDSKILRFLYYLKCFLAFLLMPPIIMWIIGEGVALRCCCNPYSKSSDCRACVGRLVQFITFILLTLILISNYIIVLPILYIFSAMYIYVNPLKVKVYVDDACSCCNPIVDQEIDYFEIMQNQEKQLDKQDKIKQQEINQKQQQQQLQANNINDSHINMSHVNNSRRPLHNNQSHMEHTHINGINNSGNKSVNSQESPKKQQQQQQPKPIRKASSYNNSNNNTVPNSNQETNSGKNAPSTKKIAQIQDKDIEKQQNGNHKNIHFNDVIVQQKDKQVVNNNIHNNHNKKVDNNNNDHDNNDHAIVKFTE